MILAHGLAVQADEALPSGFVALGVVAALAATTALLHRRWTTPRLRRVAGGRAVIRWPSALVGGAWALGFAAFAVVVVAAWIGPEHNAPNLAPVALYAVLWVGVPVASAAVGDVWRALAPWAPRWWRGGVDRPWAAAGGLVAFAWLELCYHGPSSPTAVGVALVAWAALAIAVADPLAAWTQLVAAGAPLHRDDDGRLRLRPPGAGLAAVVATPAAVAVVVVVLGSTAFDGLSRTAWWADVLRTRTGWAATAFATAGLALATAVVALVLRTGAELAARATGGDADEVGVAFAPALVPLALGSVVAHSLGLLVVAAQSLVAIASDPFGQGWDLFGTAHRTFDPNVSTSAAVAWAQVGVLVVAQVAATVVAHDRAVERDGADASRTVLPLVAAAALYAVGCVPLLR